MKPLHWRASWCVVLLLAVFVFSWTYANAQSEKALEQDLSVTEASITAQITEDGSVEVVLPVRDKYWLPVRGDVTVSITDLSGKVLAKAGRSASLFRYRNVTVPVAVKKNDLANPDELLIAYKVATNEDETTGTVSLGRFLGSLETIVLGSDELLAGSSAGFRIIARDHYTAKAAKNAHIHAWLVKEKKKLQVYEGPPDGFGTARATFQVPESWSGNAVLHVEVTAGSGTDKVERSVRISRKTKVMLTTDKPLYQPGQTIHIRSLSLKLPDRKAAKEKEVVLEVEDSKGNKVFKKKGSTGDFGVFAADFVLASELNMGSYTVRALVGEEKTEKTVTVSRYVLPKFKIELETEREYYLPGETLKGTIRTDYFFGKPVSGAKLKITAAKFDMEFKQFAIIDGVADKNGRYEFEIRIPDYFVGQPLLQGKAMVKLDAKATDAADHDQEKTITIPIAKDPLNAVAIPESGTLVAGVENEIYLVLSTPDGKPAAGVQVENPFQDGGELTTDELGMVVLHETPGKEGLSFTIHALDGTGRRLERDFTLKAGEGDEQILLRTNKPVFKAGDEALLTAMTSARSASTVYFDIIRQGQPVFITASPLEDGKAQASVTLSDDFSGTLQIRAYVIGENTDVISDTRVSYVHPADELVIRIRPDKKSYRPGGPVKVDFTVTDRQKHPVLAAIGVNIVDESVFALQDMQPGLEKVFYTIEKELMTPRFEFHEYSVDAIPGIKLDEKAEKAYRILLASVEDVPEYAMVENTFISKSMTTLQAAMQILYRDQGQIQQAIYAFYNKMGRYPEVKEGLEILVEKGFLKAEVLTDPWGNQYDFDPHPASGPFSYVVLKSMGPDEKNGTLDDLATRGGRWGRQQRMLRGGGELFFDGIEEAEAEGVFDLAMPMAAKAAPAVGAANMKEEGRKYKKDRDTATRSLSKADKAGVRVRKYFPETLLFTPALITGPDGKATLSFDMADSITIWRLSAMGSSALGLLGSKTAPMRAFQDFFVDIDFPVALTQGDEVSVPVAVYNYMERSQVVRIEAQEADWYELLEGERLKKISLKPGEVSSVHFRIKAKRIGRQAFTVYGIGDKLRDAIRREVDVEPDGKEHLFTSSGRISGLYTEKVNIPKESIDDASKIFVKIYPGLMSQVLEGMDNIFRMPSGCFEQTSSTTYPNVIVLDYMKKADILTPEIQMKAEGFINQGYQRLLSFEVSGGGFEWFGNDPAHMILTAYGLMEFYDMSLVHNVDPNVISRTARWLSSKQEKDGSWKPSSRVLDTVASKFRTDVIRNTAYITWALSYSGHKNSAVDRGLAYLENNRGKVKDAYTAALLTNAFAAADPDGDKTKEAVRALLAMGTEKDDMLFWQTSGATPTMARGASADIETTGLAAQALIRTGAPVGTVNKVINYLVSTKDAYGTWHSTQATVYAIKALTMAIDNAASGLNGEVIVSINGKDVNSFAITPENSDVMRLVDLKEQTREGVNDVNVRFDGEGAAMVQIVGRYYLPWKKKVKAADPITIDVKYDRTELETGDTITETVTVKSTRPGRFGMVVVDLGIPPGFEVQSGDLAELVGEKTIQKFSVTGRQLVVYLDEVVQGKPVKFSYRLKAKYPIKAQTPKSRVYEYYNPDAEGFAEPVEMVVK